MVGPFSFLCSCQPEEPEAGFFVSAFPPVGGFLVDFRNQDSPSYRRDAGNLWSWSISEAHGSNLVLEESSLFMR